MSATDDLWEYTDDEVEAIFATASDDHAVGAHSDIVQVIADLRRDLVAKCPPMNATLAALVHYANDYRSKSRAPGEHGRYGVDLNAFSERRETVDDTSEARNQCQPRVGVVRHIHDFGVRLRKLLFDDADMRATSERLTPTVGSRSDDPTRTGGQTVSAMQLLEFRPDDITNEVSRQYGYDSADAERIVGEAASRERHPSNLGR